MTEALESEKSGVPAVGREEDKCLIVRKRKKKPPEKTPDGFKVLSAFSCFLPL